MAAQKQQFYRQAVRRKQPSPTRTYWKSYISIGLALVLTIGGSFAAYTQFLSGASLREGSTGLRPSASSLLSSPRNLEERRWFSTCKEAVQTDQHLYEAKLGDDDVLLSRPLSEVVKADNVFTSIIFLLHGCSHNHEIWRQGHMARVIVERLQRRDVLLLAWTSARGATTGSGCFDMKANPDSPDVRRALRIFNALLKAQPTLRKASVKSLGVSSGAGMTSIISSFLPIDVAVLVVFPVVPSVFEAYQKVASGELDRYLPKRIVYINMPRDINLSPKVYKQLPSLLEMGIRVDLWNVYPSYAQTEYFHRFLPSRFSAEAGEHFLEHVAPVFQKGSPAGVSALTSAGLNLTFDPRYSKEAIAAIKQYVATLESREHKEFAEECCHADTQHDGQVRFSNNGLCRLGDVQLAKSRTRSADEKKGFAAESAALVLELTTALKTHYAHHEFTLEYLDEVVHVLLGGER